MKKLLIFRPSAHLWMALVFCLLTYERGFAQSEKIREPFEVYIEHVDRANHYHKLAPQVEFVYGSATSTEPGYLAVITPHPENAAVSRVPFEAVSSSDFRVWVEAGVDRDGWKNIGMFKQNNQTLQYLDVRRRNTKPFAIFISDSQIKSTDVTKKLSEYSSRSKFLLMFKFAKRITSKWPLEWADPVYSSGRATFLPQVL